MASYSQRYWRRCLNAHLDEGKRYHRRSCIVVCSGFFRGSPAPQKSQEWGRGRHQCDRKSNGRARTELLLARTRDCPRAPTCRRGRSFGKFIDDPLVKEYVNRIGQNLVRASDARVPFTFKVIDSEEGNAFALPGGFLYVNLGLILLADEESELAGVMAHEIAHVCARHETRSATKSEIAHLATTSLILFGPGGWAGFAIYTGLKV